MKFKKMVSDITISKGVYSVTIHSVEVTQNLTNKIFPISPATGKQNQDGGAKDTKIVDLLKITKELNITRGYITGSDTASSVNNDSGGSVSITATQAKDIIKNIFNGAFEKGGVTSLTYDGDTLYGFLEKVSITYVSADEPSTIASDIAKYSVQINFMEGTTIGG